MVRKGERAGEIGRTEPVDAVDSDLKCIAAPGAELVGQTPIGARTGKRKADDRIGRNVIVHAASEAESVGRDIVGADCGIAAESRAPRSPTLIEYWLGGALLRIEA